MATNVALDDRLIRAAQKLGSTRQSEREVSAALKEYVAHRKQLGVLELFGTIDFDPAYDYKKERRRR